MEPLGKEHMTNGKKLLGMGIFTFLVVTLGSVALADGTTERNTTDAEEIEVVAVQEMSPPSDQYVIDVQIAALTDFLNEQNRIEAEKVAATEAAAKEKETSYTVSVAPNYDPGDGSRWDQLAVCESGGNWAYPPVSGGFSGGIMFHVGTWKANGGEEFAPDAYQATREQQIIVAERVLSQSGWGAWPGCSRKFGWI